MKKLLRFLKPYRGIAITGTVFKFIEAVLELLIPLLMAMLIDNGVSAGNEGYIVRMGLLMLALAVVGAGSAYVCQYFASVTSQSVGTDIRNSLFAKINRLEYDQLDQFSTTSLTNRVTNDVKDLQYAVAMLIRLVVRVPFLCAGGLVMAFLINWKLALILVVAMPLFFLVIVVVMKKNARLYRAVQVQLDGLALSTKESLSGARVIRAFSKSDEMSEKFNQKNENYVRIQKKSILVAAFFSPLTTLIINAAVIAILYFGGIQIDAGTLTQGEIIAFINYVNMILQALIVLANLVITFTKASAAAIRVNEVFDTPVREGGSLPVSPKADAPQIVFDRVTFSYSEGGEPEIEDVSFSVGRGETLGIIGGTGSGKTTLVNLLLGMYRPKSGEVKIYGDSLAELDRRAYLQKVGYVPQKATLFSGTVRENLLAGNPGAGEEALSRAVEVSQSKEILARMKDGLETEVERGGVNLSGGQKQRLTIARALVKTPELIVFDDSFSALDYATDLRLRRAVKKHFKCTKIFVSQRVSSIKGADKILVLDGGRAVGFGTHEELLSSCETYREIEASQRSLA